MASRMQPGELSHPFPPCFDAGSKILIVGTFPSVQSREAGFYYGNPRNRFWRVVSELLGWPLPEDIPQKKVFLSQAGIALFDVLESCEIRGSSDASIRRAVPNRFDVLFERAQIRKVFANGRAACAYYQKFINSDVICLPSTSPANAAWTLDRLKEAWSVILPFLEG